MGKKLFQAIMAGVMIASVISSQANAAGSQNTITNSDAADAENYAKDTVTGGSTMVTGSFGRETTADSVNGVTQISVEVPASVNFTVDGSSETNITFADIEVENKSAAPVVVKVKDFKKTEGDYTLVADPSDVANWKSLSHAERKIALGIRKPKNSRFCSEKTGNVDNGAGEVIWATAAGGQNAALGMLTDKSGENARGRLILETYHGTSFSASEADLSLGTYELTWSIALY